MRLLTSTVERYPQLASLGVWSFTDHLDAVRAASFAAEIERLGYSSLFVPETTGRDPFTHLAALGTHTTSLVLATGIANIFHRHPGAMHQAAMTLAEQVGDRFLLGLGVSHAPLVEGLRKVEYTKPRSQMQRYLAAMQASPYAGPAPPNIPPRILAALGPRMLELAGAAGDGAHTYFASPDHTSQAREILGPEKILIVEQKVLLQTVPSRARAIARRAVARYARLPNYRANWMRLGFSEREVDDASDRLVDRLVAWGTEDDLRVRIREHLDAGATHVCIQPLGAAGDADIEWSVLEALAPANA